jgi:hypothetical protein
MFLANDDLQSNVELAGKVENGGRGEPGDSPVLGGTEM